QGGERPGRRGVLEALDGGVLEGQARVERREVVHRPQPCPGPDLVDVEPAYGGQQVGAERQVGTAAALEDGEHLGERVGDQVVGVGRTCELPREAACGVDVTREELAVGVDVTTADRRDEFGVAGSVDRQRDAHTNSNGFYRDL